MHSKGEKIETAIERHKVSGSLDGLAKTLETRPLGAKHFAAAKKFMKGTLDAAIEKIHGRLDDTADANANIKLENRALELTLMYMAVNKDDTEEYIPAVANVFIAQTIAKFFARRLPLRLRAPHLEYRHIQRSAQVLDYKETSFNQELYFSLLLARTIEDRVPNNPAENIPVVIPRQNGMFLCKARKVAADSFIPENHLIVVYNPRERRGMRVTTPLGWSPTAEISVDTYIHQGDFSPNQRALHHELMQFMHNPDRMQAIMNLGTDYSLGAPETFANPIERQFHQSALEHLTRITKGEAWKTEAAIAARNIAGRPNAFTNTPRITRTP